MTKFVWPDRADMSPSDLKAWDGLVELVWMFMRLPRRSDDASPLASAVTLEKFPIPNYLLLRGMRKAQLPAASVLMLYQARTGEKIFPDFLLPILNQFLDGLDNLLGSGDGAPSWGVVQSLIETMMHGDLGIDFPAAKETLVRQLPHLLPGSPEKVEYLSVSGGSLTPVQTTVGRYASRQLGLESGLDELANLHRFYTAPAEELVQFVENSDLDGWRDIYGSEHVSSCMNRREYGVTYYETYRCYAAAAHGLPDNGLRLAWLGHMKHRGDRTQAVARAIVHEPTQTFVRVYGDNSLKSLLLAMGYTKASEYPEGLILYTEELDEGYISPYVDGELTYADLHERQICYWELSSDGAYDLSDTSGLVTGAQTCPCCGRVAILDHSILTAEGDTDVCEYCGDMSIMAYYMGYIRPAYEPDCIEATSDGLGSDWFVDTRCNLKHYDIRPDGPDDQFVYGDGWVEALGSNTLEHITNVVELTYLGEYAMEHACCEFNGFWILEEDMISVKIGGTVYEVPSFGLADDIDSALTAYLAELEEEVS